MVRDEEMERIRTVVNFHDRVRLTNFKVEMQIERTDGRHERDGIGFEGSGAEIASIDRVDRLVIQHHTHEAFTPGALVEIGPEGQRVRLPDGDDQILTQT